MVLVVGVHAHGRIHLYPFRGIAEEWIGDSNPLISACLASTAAARVRKIRGSSSRRLPHPLARRLFRDRGGPNITASDLTNQHSFRGPRGNSQEQRTMT